jgi:hypothetical protein
MDQRGVVNIRDPGNYLPTLSRYLRTRVLLSFYTSWPMMSERAVIDGIACWFEPLHCYPASTTHCINSSWFPHMHACWS